ncbi:oligophrenin [Clonorchis sinensis]|uniref:Oligophrenin n=1 Tax=Clonorchis sinensis TaxID=79923 RepID=G7YR63_CLOSI|nr:oligophrenin [Clonorchis sinensis]
MPPLQPLEFRDCVVDGPHFRSALQNHEKELKAHGKLVKGVYSNAERVFKAMDGKFTGHLHCILWNCTMFFRRCAS